MSKTKSYFRPLERHRTAVKGKPVAENMGKGKAKARAAQAEAMKLSMQRRKNSNKLVRELEALSVADLQTQLAATRQELFNLRFRHAVAQLENVASIPAARRRIARILTLIKQKEVGA